MAPNSKITKFIFVNQNGKEVETPNLYIDEVTKNFYVRVYHNGRTLTRSLKTKNFTVAKSRITSTIQAILSGKKKSKDQKLVKDFIEDFMAAKKTEGLSPATITRYEVSWAHHIEPFWGIIQVSEIDQTQVSRFVAWHNREKGGTLFNHLKLLRGLFEMFEDLGHLVKAPRVVLPKTERDASLEGKGTFITKAEIQQILEASQNDTLTLLIEMAYGFGFRIGELAGLQKSRVKIEGKLVIIELRASDTKTRKPRKVPLNLRISEKLKKHLKATEGPFVFPQRRGNGAIDTQTIDKWWRKNLKEAGIRRRIRFHDLRHTAATNFANLDISPIKACAVLGMSVRIFEATYVKKNRLDFSSITELDTLEGL